MAMRRTVFFGASQPVTESPRRTVLIEAPPKRVTCRLATAMSVLSVRDARQLAR